MRRTFTRGLVALALALPTLAALSSVPAHAAVFRLPADVRSPCAASARGHATCGALAVTRRTDARPQVTPSGFAPADLRSAYSLPTTTSLGGGETVAVVTAYDDPDAETDLGTYRSQYALGACTTASGCFKKVSQTGGTTYPPTSAGWSAAVAQSLDMISAICPACHLLLVEASSTALTDLGTAENQAVTLGAGFVDNDWFTPEAGLGASETSDDAAYFNHPGVAITAPAGNSGYGVNYPAASPDVTAVGGTTLAKTGGSGRGWTETTWTGSGSGCSAYEPKPGWQTDTGCAGRTLNDTAAVADPNTPIAYYDTPTAGGWGEGGGTDVAAALVAATYALGGPPAPGTNPASYLYDHPGANMFDVTSGSNGTCSPAYLCTAEVGYDGPTGWGTPDGVSGFSPYEVAFQANNNHLWFYTPTNAGERDTSLGMAAGTSPAVASTGEVAFEGSNNHLWLYDPSTGGSRDTGLGMEAGTSPAIVFLAGGGGYEIAFQANTGILWLNDPSTGKSINTGLGMDKVTSPAITATSSGSYEVAFQANSNDLWYYTPSNAGDRDTGLGMATSTSPSITDTSSGSPEIAFQANNSHLWYYTPSNAGDRDTGLGMAAGTSPSITGMSSGSPEIAFQANNSHLWYYTPSNAGDRDTGLGMAAGTSPSITGTSSGSPEIAFQGSNSHLWYYTPTNDGDRGLGMAAGTSPAILQPS